MIQENAGYEWIACKRISWPETVPENITKAVIGSNWERNVSSLFVGEEHCVIRQKRLRDSEGDYQVYKYFPNL